MKEKYKIESNKPIVVVGCPAVVDNFQIPELEKIVRELKDKAMIYFVGHTSDCHDYLHNINSSVRIIEANGVLRDYYAIADASVINRNVVFDYHDSMHNFIEATAGGPLFLVRPGNTAQYGYFELERLGVIKETGNIFDLISKLKQYLDSPNGEEIRKARALHLERSRNLYLSDILKILNKASGLSEEHPNSDLRANLWRKFSLLSKVKYKPRLRIFHKDTVWRPFRKEEIETVEVSKIPQEVYKKYRRGR